VAGTIVPGALVVEHHDHTGAVVLRPVGRLDVASYAQLRDVLLKHAAEKPRVSRFVPTFRSVRDAVAAIGAPPLRRRAGLTLLAHPHRAHSARGWVREFLAGRRLTPAGGFVDDVVLVASELMENSIRHAGSPDTLSVERHVHGLSIAVSDDDARDPVLVPPEADQRRWARPRGGGGTLAGLGPPSAPRGRQGRVGRAGGARTGWTGPERVDVGMLRAPDDPVAPARPRRVPGPAAPFRRLGLTGALLMAIGALGAGALPVPNPLFGVRLLGLPSRNDTLSLALAYAGAVILVIAWVGVARQVCTNRAAPSGRELVRAAALWALPLAAAPPLFSRDVYSYLAQGTILARGLDPYALSPARALGVDSPLVRSIPTLWRDTPAPYGPLFLGVSRTISDLTGNDLVLGLLAQRAVALAGLALMVWALPALARRCGVDARRAFWFGAANPLVLFHLVSGVHNEALMLGLALAGLELGLRAGPRVLDPHLLGGAALIIAGSAVKLPAILALGFLGLAWARGRGPGNNAGLRDVAAATGLLSALTVAGYGLLSVATGIGPGLSAEFTVPTAVDSPFSLSTDLGFVSGWLGAAARLGNHTTTVVPVVQDAALVVAAPVVAWFLHATLRGRLDPVAALAGAMGAVVVLGPAGQPWYVLWCLLPLAATPALPRLRRAALVTSAVLALVVPPTGADFGFRGYQLVTAIAGALVVAAAVLAWHRRSASVGGGGPGPLTASEAGSAFEAGSGRPALPGLAGVDVRRVDMPVDPVQEVADPGGEHRRQRHGE